MIEVRTVDERRGAARRDCARSSTTSAARSPTRSGAERWLKNFELERMLAALDDGSIVGGAGAFTFRMTVPGGAAARLRRRDGRRRPADAPPPRDPPLDDARPARRHPRAGRAARRAVGLRGDDLRPLRLRPRLARARVRDPAGRTARSGRASSRSAACGSSTPDEAARLMPPVYDAVQRAHAGHVRARPSRGGSTACSPTRPSSASAAGPKHLAVLEVDGEPQAYAIYRLHVAFGSLGPGDDAAHDRGDRRDRRRRPPRSGATSSTSTGRRRCRRGSSPSTARCFLLLARPSLARARRCSDGLWVRLVDVGAALSGARVRGRRGGRPRRPRRVLPVERGPLAARGRARRRAPTRTPTSRSTSPTSPRPTSAASRSASSANAGRVEELREGAIARADALFHTDVAPVVSRRSSRRATISPDPGG